jgi:plasmid stabilization system protein ParE
LRVVFARAAQRQAETIAAWWRANRPAAATLFVDELEAARALLSDSPLVGEPYDAATLIGGVRRLLLVESQYHVYYTVDEQRRLAIVRAVWHVMRGRGPRLR